MQQFTANKRLSTGAGQTGPQHAAAYGQTGQTGNVPSLVLPPLVHPIVYFNPETLPQQQQPQQLQQQQPLHLQPIQHILPLPVPSAHRAMSDSSSTTTTTTTSGSISPRSSLSRPMNNYTTAGTATTTTTTITTANMGTPKPMSLFTNTASLKQQQQQQQHAALSASAHPTEACLWAQCSARFYTPEELYLHLCNDHVGRKVKNNLSLKCLWGEPCCGNEVIKRDHMTSHLRVHVSFKPHFCQECHKKFKRPQDLKKHQRVHQGTQALENSAFSYGSLSYNSFTANTGGDLMGKRVGTSLDSLLGDSANKRIKYSLPPLESILQTGGAPAANNANAAWNQVNSASGRYTSVSSNNSPTNSSFQLRNYQQNAHINLDDLLEKLTLNDAQEALAYDPNVLEEGEIRDDPLFTLSPSSPSPLYPIIAV